MQPIRTRLVASAIAPSSVHPSNTSPRFPRGPIDAKWSKFQQWSKPASCAIRQTARSSSTGCELGRQLQADSQLVHASEPYV
jgi:hypothetical protein